MTRISGSSSPLMSQVTESPTGSATPQQTPSHSHKTVVAKFQGQISHLLKTKLSINEKKALGIAKHIPTDQLLLVKNYLRDGVLTRSNDGYQTRERGRDIGDELHFSGFFAPGTKEDRLKIRADVLVAAANVPRGYISLEPASFARDDRSPLKAAAEARRAGEQAIWERDCLSDDSEDF